MGLFDLFKKGRPGALAGQPSAPPAAQGAVEPVAESTGNSTGVGAGPTAPTSSPPQSTIRSALNRTRAFLATAFTTNVDALADEDFYDELADGLLRADVGGELAASLVAQVRRGMAERGLVRKRDASGVLRDAIARLLSDVRPVEPLVPGRLSVLLIVGVNGSGKTTLCAKLALRLKDQGLFVLLAAADTFRAAATEQLRIWAQRAGVDIVAGQEGSDPAAVVFDAVTAAVARGTDVLIVDTAGRLQTKANLMAELGKISRVVGQAALPVADSDRRSGLSHPPNLAHILVLDATVGQNALSQAELFNAACPVTGLALTKLDGTAKGGAVLAAVARLRAPVLYLGVGEGIGDVLDFDAQQFAAALVGSIDD